MMTICPSCFELYSEIWSKPCCSCGCKTVSVSVELIGLAKLLINRGFKVSSASCHTHKAQCVCEHPPSECNPESIAFDKEITISNLETWLENKDPDACKAVLTLAWCL